MDKQDFLFFPNFYNGLVTQLKMQVKKFPNILWTSVLPLRYLIFLGVTAQATSIRNGTNLNLATNFNFPNGLPLTYYWRIVPVGFGGVSGNCATWSFSTNVPVINTFPYTEDFESLPSNFSMKIQAHLFFRLDFSWKWKFMGLGISQ